MWAEAPEYDLADWPTGLDFALVHADDEFLDALSTAAPNEFLGGELAVLLAAWRQDVDAEPIGDLIDPQLAVATVQAAALAGIGPAVSA